MGSWLALLPGLVFGDIDLKLQSCKRNAGFSAVVLLFIVTAYVFLMIAAAIALSGVYGALVAGLIIGGASLGIALVLLGVMASLNARDRRIAAERRTRKAAATNLAMATGLTLFRKNPLVAVGAAIAIGTVLGLTAGKRRDDD